MSDPQRPEREAIAAMLADIRHQIDHGARRLKTTKSDHDRAVYSSLQIVYRDMESRLDALLAALPPTPTPGWQPMETAKQDGRAIIGLTWDNAVIPVFWSPVDGWKHCGDGWRAGAAPRLVGWQPLPPAPTGDRS